jgi:hypothetical protein
MMFLISFFASSIFLSRHLLSPSFTIPIPLHFIMIISMEEQHLYVVDVYMFSSLYICYHDNSGSNVCMFFYFRILQ